MHLISPVSPLSRLQPPPSHGIFSPLTLVAAERGPTSLPVGAREPATFSPVQSSSGPSSGRRAWPVRTHLTPRGKDPSRRPVRPREQRRPTARPHGVARARDPVAVASSVEDAAGSSDLGQLCRGGHGFRSTRRTCPWGASTSATARRMWIWTCQATRSRIRRYGSRSSTSTMRPAWPRWTALCSSQQAWSIGGGNMTDAVMHGLSPDSVAIHRELVSKCAVCGRWFAVYRELVSQFYRDLHCVSLSPTHPISL